MARAWSKQAVTILTMCFLACLILTPTPIAAVQAAKATPQDCGDFLAEIDKKPAHLDYVGCAYVPDRQGKPLRAIYHVSGRFAAATEAALVKSVGLRRLKRSCCLWDSPARQFKDAHGREFSISMTSEETIAATRADWPRIKIFEVVVETFTEYI